MGDANAERAEGRKRLGFLRSKFEVPARPRPFIPEERISARLDDLASWDSCLLGAPAGVGKTALMAQWCEEWSQRPGVRAYWVELDRHDADALRFMESLATCLAEDDAAFASIADACRNGADGEAALIELMNLMDAAFADASHAIIFLDGYEAASSETLDDILLSLNRNMARNAHLVVAGGFLSDRLGDMVFDSRVEEFGIDDLAFGEERIEALAAALGVELAGTAWEARIESIRYCPIVLSFIGNAQRKAKDGADAERRVAGYCARFFEKALVPLVSEDELRFLVRTALLERLDPELCDRVLGEDGSEGILTGLAARNLFIVRDAGSGAYIRNEFLCDFLRDKLLAEGRDAIRVGASRASRWYARQGNRCASAKYLAMACDPFYLEGTVGGSTGLDGSGISADLAGSLMRIPARRFEEDPYLAWAAVWSCISAGLVEDARHWIGAARLIGTAEDSRAYVFADALCLALEGDSAGSLAAIRGLLEESDAQLPRQFQCLLIQMEGENCERLGMVREGRDRYLKAFSLAERNASPFYKTFDLYLLAQHYLSMGMFEDADAIARQALASCAPASVLEGAFLSVQASIQVERCELDAAQAVLERAARCVSADSNADMYVDVNLARARLERVRGNKIEAMEIICEVVDALDGKCVPRNMDMRAFALKMALAVELDEMTAARSCERAIDAFLDDPDAFRAVYCLFAKVRLLWKAGLREEAYRLLDKAARVAEQTGSLYFLTQLAVMRASCWCEAGDEPRAMVEMSRAIEMAMRAGYRSVFLEGETCVRELLLKLATARQTSLALRNYAKEVLLLFEDERAIDEQIALSRGDVQGYYALTEREREILQKLNAGMSRAEIALSLSVSQNTVKSHLKNIYSKMGVHTRSEAYRASAGMADAARAAADGVSAHQAGGSPSFHPL